MIHACLEIRGFRGRNLELLLDSLAGGNNHSIFETGKTRTGQPVDRQLSDSLLASAIRDLQTETVVDGSIFRQPIHGRAIRRDTD